MEEGLFLSWRRPQPSMVGLEISNGVRYEPLRGAGLNLSKPHSARPCCITTFSSAWRTSHVAELLFYFPFRDWRRAAEGRAVASQQNIFRARRCSVPEDPQVLMQGSGQSASSKRTTRGPLEGIKGAQRSPLRASFLLLRYALATPPEIAGLIELESGIELTLTSLSGSTSRLEGADSRGARGGWRLRGDPSPLLDGTDTTDNPRRWNKLPARDERLRRTAGT